MYPANNFNQPQQIVPAGNYPAFQPMGSQPQFAPGPMRTVGDTLATMNRMPQMLPGRMVANISEVQPSEVPMDGSVSIFPQSDYSAIYAKIWDQNGNIQTFKFVPEVEVVAEPESDSSFRDIVIERLDNIETMIKRNNNYHKRKNYQKQPKENDNE